MQNKNLSYFSRTFWVLLLRVWDLVNCLDQTAIKKRAGINLASHLAHTSSLPPNSLTGQASGVGWYLSAVDPLRMKQAKGRDLGVSSKTADPILWMYFALEKDVRDVQADSFIARKTQKHRKVWNVSQPSLNWIIYACLSELKERTRCLQINSLKDSPSLHNQLTSSC